MISMVDCICPKFKRRYQQSYTRLNFAEALVDVSVENMLRMKSVVCPMSPDGMADLLCEGYRDTLAFLSRHGIISQQTAMYLTVRSVLSTKEICKVL